jgi:hypothetical protein
MIQIKKVKKRNMHEYDEMILAHVEAEKNINSVTVNKIIILLSIKFVHERKERITI